MLSSEGWHLRSLHVLLASHRPHPDTATAVPPLSPREHSASTWPGLGHTLLPVSVLLSPPPPGASTSEAVEPRQCWCWLRVSDAGRECLVLAVSVAGSRWEPGGRGYGIYSLLQRCVGRESTATAAPREATWDAGKWGKCDSDH